MLERQFITRKEWKQHVQGDWRTAHGLWGHLRDYVPGWGYSRAELDAFFEGEDAGKKQVDWARITNPPATYPPSAHASEHEVGGGDLIDFASITGFGDYLDQAVKQASDVQFADGYFTGDVGINIATPGAPLEVFKDAAGADTTGGGLIVSRFRVGGNYRGSAIYSRYITGPNVDALILAATGVDAKNPYSDFDQARMFILSSGNVGIGKVPTCALDVNGTIKATTWYLNLGGLLDVNLGSLEEGETIVYDQGATEWIDAWGVEYDNPRLVWKMYTDFFSLDADGSPPWTGGVLTGGSTSLGIVADDHPGVIKFNSAASAGSGYYFGTNTGCIIIAGREHAEFVFLTSTSLTNRYAKFGFQDSFATAAPQNGIYINMAGTVLTGKTRKAGAESTTGTPDDPLVANTWYRVKIAVNDEATLVTFILYNAAGLQLWSDTLATNIPIVAVGHGALAYISAATAGTLIHLDMMVASKAGAIHR